MPVEMKVIGKKVSSDGCVKFLLQLSDELKIESVYLPSGERRTVCVSSQAGCALDCSFCATGRMGLARNLSAEEITGQLELVLREVSVEDRSIAATNVVYMGMGEPFYNYDAVLRAAHLFSNQRGLNIAPGRITLSTAGVLPAMEKYFMENHAYKLALSLTSAMEEKRNILMPINRRYPLSELRKLLLRFPRKRVLLEIPLLAGINDGPEDIEALLVFCDGLRVRVNLIPWNPSPGETFTRPSDESVLAFQRSMRRTGLNVFIRKSLGSDIAGACGQLVTDLAQISY